MTIRKGTNSGLYVLTAAAGVSPAVPINQWNTLSGTTAGGKAFSIATDAARAGTIVSCIYDGVQLISATDHGRGIVNAWNKFPTGESVASNVNSPTAPGSQDDGSNLTRGSSVQLYRYVDNTAAPTRLITRMMPAYWHIPGQASLPGHPALNKRVVSQWTTTVDNQLNYLGNPNLISFLTDVYVPDESWVPSGAGQILDMVSLSIIALQTVFDTVEYLDPATGTVTAYPGFPDTSQTKVCMISKADGTIAMCPFQVLSEWGATGYAQCWVPSIVNTFIRAKEVSAGAIASGMRRYSATLALGTRAEVIAAIQAAHAGMTTRTTDIVLPDLAA